MGIFAKALNMRTIIIMAIILSGLTLATQDFAYAADSIYPVRAKVDAVSATDHTITVEGYLKVHVKLRGKPIQLYALEPYQSLEDYEQMTPVAVLTERLVGARFIFEIDRYHQAQDRLYSKFLVVVPDSLDALEEDDVNLIFNGDDLIIDYPQHVINYNFQSEYSWLQEAVISKKGVFDDGLRDSAEEVGSAHGKVAVVLNKLLYKDASVAPVDAVPFTFEGNDYYIRKDYLDQLDNSIMTVTRNGATVLLALLIQKLEDDPASSAFHMIHPDALINGAGVVLPGWNVTNDTGIRYFKAAFEFLFSRYMRDDQQYGRVTGIKVANEVNAQWVWHNSGEKTMEAFMEDYERAVRLVYNAARKYMAEPKVYISLTHYWNERRPNSSPLRHYAPREVIETMNKLSKQQGDFPWHIDYHAYPDDLFEPRFWNDAQATDSFESVLVHFKNLDVLPAYLRQNHLLYNFEPRRVILSEQGFHFISGNPNAEKIQAAAYAYAYYKTFFTEGIDIMHYHRMKDSTAEGGLLLGLWTTDGNIPNERRLLYDVFEKIDTVQSLEVTEFAKDVLGIEEWEELIPEFEASKLAIRELPASVGTIPVETANNVQWISQFESGADGWSAAENATDAHIVSYGSGDHAFQVNLDSERKLWKGAQVFFDEPLDMTGYPYLKLALQLDDVDTIAENYEVKVKVYGPNIGVNDYTWVEGKAALIPNGNWQQIALDLSQWSGLSEVERIKVWVRSTNDKAVWNGHLKIDNIGFAQSVTRKANQHQFAVEGTWIGEPSVGANVRITILNHDVLPLSGTAQIVTHPNVTFDTTQLQLTTLPTGGTQTFLAEVTSLSYPQNRTITFNVLLNSTTVQETVYLPEKQIMLYDFEASAQGWQAGANVTSLERVSTSINQPQVPKEGAYMLEMLMANTVANTWRTAYVTMSQPVDWSEYNTFYYHINGYGLPGSTGYEARVTLTDELNNTFSRTHAVQNAQWNTIEIPMTEINLTTVKKIEISYRSLDPRLWSGKFQIDAIELK